MKTLEEFLSIVETFPTSIAKAIGNQWSAQDVLVVIGEIRQNRANLGVQKKLAAYGALDPAELEEIRNDSSSD